MDEQTAMELQAIARQIRDARNRLTALSSRLAISDVNGWEQSETAKAGFFLDRSLGRLAAIDIRP